MSSGSERIDDQGPDGVPTRNERWSAFWSRANYRSEKRYLGLLRTSILIIASILLIGATCSAIYGIGAQFGTTHVVPLPIRVTGEDIVATPEVPDQASRPRASSPVIVRWQQELPVAFRRQYFNLYRRQFVPFNRSSDLELTAPQFFAETFPDDQLDRMAAIDDTALLRSDEQRQADQTKTSIVMLLAAMTSASADTQTVSELQAYKNARRVQVCRDEARVRTRSVQQWDRYGLSCPYWYEDGGCAVNRTVREPYSERICSMQFPNDVSQPLEAMQALQGTFITKVEDNIVRAALAAEEQAVSVAARKQNGREYIALSGKIFFIFLGLMLLYVIVAIERHHRQIITRLMAKYPEPAG